ncbi:MAG: hypothetical protein ABEI96_11720 [Haloarculaceae archaeon]
MTDDRTAADAATDTEESSDPDGGEAAAAPDGAETATAPDGREAAAAPGGREATAASDEPGTSDGRNPMTYVQWAAFVVLSLLALVATFRFYTAASRAIGIWISPDYEPFFQAGFNLVVLATAAIGLSLLARRLRQ